MDNVRLGALVLHKPYWKNFGSTTFRTININFHHVYVSVHQHFGQASSFRLGKYISGPGKKTFQWQQLHHFRTFYSRQRAWCFLSSCDRNHSSAVRRSFEDSTVSLKLQRWWWLLLLLLFMLFLLFFWLFLFFMVLLLMTLVLLLLIVRGWRAIPH